MRARNLKPGFFTNEDLGVMPPLARLLFQGLWCEADYEGRLEDRPRRLKTIILPYDDVDVDLLLDGLHQAGMILRYTDQNGGQYIQVVNFKKHQNPHVNEKKRGSSIPAPDHYGTGTEQVLYQSGTDTALVPDLYQTDPADSLFLIPSSLIPDSGSPLPESGILIPDCVSNETLAPSDADASSEPAGDEAETGSDQPQKTSQMPKAAKGESPEEYHQRYMAWARDLIARLKESRREEWANAYPGVDIDRECAKAAVWLDANPSKRKKKIPAFIANWLARTQERGGVANCGSPIVSRAEQKQATTINAVNKILEDIGNDDE